MSRDLRYGETTALLLSVVASALLFYSGLFAFLFAVPVQVMFTRRGERQGELTAAVTGAAIVAIHLLQVLRIDGVRGEFLRLLFLDSLMPVGLLAGLVVFNAARRFPWWGRLMIGAAIAVLATVPSLRILSQAGSGEGALAEQMDTMMEMLGVTENSQALLRMVRQVALNTIGVGLTAAIAANWWLGRSLVLRRYGLAQSLRSARVDPSLVWLVIVGLALVVGTWITEAPRLAPAGWNILLVGSFLYGVQGIGLIQHLLRRRGLPERGERWVLTVAMLLMFVPGINLLVVVGVPLVGMSEVWVDYKRGEEYEGHSEY